MHTKRKRRQAKHKKVAFRGRSYKDYVKEQLQTELLLENWDLFYNSRDVNYCWGFIENAIRKYLNRTCPQKDFKVKEIREIWVTNEILEEIKDKDRALAIAKRSGKVEDWRFAKSERNRVGRLVEQAKAEFLKEQQVELADDPKKFWRLVKSVVPGKRRVASKISLVKRDSKGEGREVCE